MILDSLIVGVVVASASGYLLWRMLPKRPKAPKAECCGGGCPADKQTVKSSV